MRAASGRVGQPELIEQLGHLRPEFAAQIEHPALQDQVLVAGQQADRAAVLGSPRRWTSGPGRGAEHVDARSAGPPSGRDSVAQDRIVVVFRPRSEPSSANTLPGATEKLSPSSAHLARLAVFRRSSCDSPAIWPRHPMSGSWPPRLLNDVQFQKRCL